MLDACAGSCQPKSSQIPPPSPSCTSSGQGGRLIHHRAYWAQRRCCRWTHLALVQSLAFLVSTCTDCTVTVARLVGSTVLGPFLQQKTRGHVALRKRNGKSTPIERKDFLRYSNQAPWSTRSTRMVWTGLHFLAGFLAGAGLVGGFGQHHPLLLEAVARGDAAP